MKQTPLKDPAGEEGNFPRPAYGFQLIILKSNHRFWQFKFFKVEQSK